jgi:hypothetical protein
VLDDEGPRVDSQLELSVLLPVWAAFTFWSFSTVSSSMVIGFWLLVFANLGDFVLDVLGAGWGSGTSVSLLHVTLLGLGSHLVHLNDNLLRFGAVVLEPVVDLDHEGPDVGGESGLGV